MTDSRTSSRSSAMAQPLQRVALLLAIMAAGAAGFGVLSGRWHEVAGLLSWLAVAIVIVSATAVALRPRPQRSLARVRRERPRD